MDPTAYIQLPLSSPLNQALSSDTFKVPPLDGSLSIPEMYDWQHLHSPNHPVFVYADDAGVVTTVRMAELVRAVHRAGRLAISEYTAHQAAPTKKPLIGVLAASGRRADIQARAHDTDADSDTITSFAFLAGIVRAGYAAFPISTRNSATAVAHLLSQTGVEHLFIGPEKPYQQLAQHAFKLLKEKGNKVPTTSTTPAFRDLYPVHDETLFEPLPWRKQEISELALYMHSSGVYMHLSHVAVY